MKIAIFGANGATGRQVANLAVADGHHVTAVVRNPATIDAASGVTVAQADVLDQDSVTAAIAGNDAIISTVGATYTRKPVSIYSQGVANIAAAMHGEGITRLVCVSSVCVAPAAPPGEKLFFRAGVRPILRLMGRTAYADMVRMESTLAQSELDWTVIRASGLFDGPEVTEYRLAPSGIPGLFTSRMDLAHALLSEAVNTANSRAVVDVITEAGTPKFRSLLVKEVSGHR